MIRYVAKAICKSRTCEGFKCCQWPAQGGRLDCNAKRGAYDDAAREAISALRNPSQAMRSAMWAHVTMGLAAGQEHKLTELWEAAIDAALAQDK
jgi:hypothetical protein